MNGLGSLGLAQEVGAPSLYICLNQFYNCETICEADQTHVNREKWYSIEYSRLRNCHRILS